MKFDDVDLDTLREKSRLKWSHVPKDTISFGTADSDFPMPSEVITKLQEELISEDLGFYSDFRGEEKTLEIIAKKVQEENKIPIDSPQSVCVTIGTMMGLFVSCMYTLGPRNINGGSFEAILQDPVYYPFHKNVKWAGGKIVWLPLNKEDGYALDLDNLQDKVTNKTRLLMFCNPLNPGGRVYNIEELRGLRDIVEDHFPEEALVMSDELYESLVFDGRKHISFASLPGMIDRTITLFGFSKGHAMAGLRLAYLILPPHLAVNDEIGRPIEGGIIDLLASIQVHAPLLLQKSLGIAITSPAVKKFAQQFCNHIQDMRDIAVKRLDSIPGVSCPKPEGALFVFPHFDGWQSEHLSERLAKEAGLSTVPGIRFGPSGEGFLRITLATSPNILNEGIDRIERFLKSHKPS